jgi:hypothetical protein
VAKKKKKKHPKHKLVVVWWTDSESEGSWEDSSAVDEWAEEEIGICISSGFLLRKTKAAITLYGDVSAETEQKGRKMRIPMPCVKKVLDIDTYTS